jgi:hypothetical protein
MAAGFTEDKGGWGAKPNPYLYHVERQRMVELHFLAGWLLGVI